MADIVTTHLTKYKADAKGHRAVVKRLRGDQKAAAKAQLEEMEKQNEAIDNQIAKWGKVVGVIGGVVVAVGALKKGFEAYQKDAQLRLAAAGTSVDKLRDSTKGLVAEQRLLQLAAANANTQFKLNEEQLNVVAQAAITLRNQGNDLGDTLNRLEKAVVEGSTEPLKELGITIEGASGKAETLQKVIARLRAENAGAAGDTDLVTDAVTRQGIRLEDAYNRISIALGKIALAMVPVLERLAAAAEFLSGASIKRAAKGVFGFVGGLNDIAEGNKTVRRGFAAGGERIGPQLTDEFRDFEGFAREGAFAGARGARLAGPAGRGVRAPQDNQSTPGRVLGLGERLGEGFTDITDLAGRGLAAAQAQLDSERSLRGDEILAGAGQGLGAGDNFVPKVSRMVEALNELRDVGTEALQAFGVATVDAFGAWVDGTESFIDATSKLQSALGQALANEMLSRAKYHAAAAFGSAAGGDYRGAGLHAAAAAGYVVGAKLTKQLMGGGGGAGGVSAPGGGVGATAAAGGRTQNLTFILGNGFGAQDDEQRARQAEDLVRRGRSLKGSDVVERI